MPQHAREHHFRKKKNMTVLSTESDWVKRGIKEAIFIRSLKPSINIDPGRHSLSSHFDQILANEVTAPPSPEPHKEFEPFINTVPRRQGWPKKQLTTTSPCSQPAQPTASTASPTVPSSQPILPQRQSLRLIQRRQQSSAS